MSAVEDEDAAPHQSEGVWYRFRCGDTKSRAGESWKARPSDGTRSAGRRACHMSIARVKRSAFATRKGKTLVQGVSF